jgi:hypothetical protein
MIYENVFNVYLILFIDFRYLGYATILGVIIYYKNEQKLFMINNILT